MPTQTNQLSYDSIDLNIRLTTLCERYRDGEYGNIAPTVPQIGTFLDRIAYNLQSSRS